MYKSRVSIPFHLRDSRSQASEDKKCQKEIGDIAGVADVTIRQSYKLMYPHAVKLFPEDFKFSTPIELLPQMWTVRLLSIEKTVWVFLPTKYNFQSVLFKFVY